MARRKGPVWNANSEDAAQLFRDFYFEKYPANITPLEVHADPDRPYRFYNVKSFYTHVASIKNRVLTYKQFGTGLENEEFVKKLRLKEKPTPEEQGAKPERLLRKNNSNNLSRQADNNNITGILEDEDSLDDETFKTTDCEEEDVPLSSIFELESCMESLSFEQKYEDEEVEEKKTQKKPAAMNRAVSNTNVDFNNEIGMKYLEALPDGRLAAIVKLPSGFDGHFAISDDGKKLVMKEIIHPTLLSAERCYAKLGLNGDSAFVVAMQSRINAMVEAHDKKFGFGVNNKIHSETVVFKLPFEVKRTFFNERGVEEHEIRIGEIDNGLEWAYFFMESIAVKKIGSPEPKISRDRNRRRDSDQATPITANSRNVTYLQNPTPQSNSNTSIQRNIRPRVLTETQFDFYSPRSEIMETEDEFTEVSVLDPDL
jgi:hypothetical protein